MKRYERKVLVEADLRAVFSFFADMERLPEWATEDFVSVKRETEGAIREGSRLPT